MKNNLTTSDNGIRLIKEFEGEILKVYADPVGLWTLGVGHLLTSEEKKQFKLGQGITPEQSTAYLRKDLQIAENAINEAVKITINQNQFDALVSLAFNIGVKAFRRSSVLRYLNAGNAQKSADAFLMWNKAGGRILAGLVRRRKTERDLFLSTKNMPGKTLVAEQIAPVVVPPVTPTSEPSTDSNNGGGGLKDFINKYGKHCKNDSVKNIFQVIGTRVLGAITTGVGTAWNMGLHGKILVVLAGLAIICPTGYAGYFYASRIIGWISDIFDSFWGEN